MFFALSAIASAHADEFPLPRSNADSLVGAIQYTSVLHGDSLLDIARAFDIGHDQIILANRRLNRWVPRVGAEVTIPSLYIIPTGQRRGIVLNLAELRLYYFPPYQQTVHTFPVSVGDYDWRTPQGRTTVVAKEIDPAWYPPKSIRAEHLSEGEELPRMIPGGDPDNPLGHFALKLGIPSYLIHGTDQRRSFGIGMRVSHGCIRLYPEDIEELFSMIKVGAPVTIIDQPIKVGWSGDQLYIEVHQPLPEDETADEQFPIDLNHVVKAIAPLIRPGTTIDPNQVDLALRIADGIPTMIGSIE